MTQTLFQYTIPTSEKQTFVNIDDHIMDALSNSGITNGIAVIYCPHTTGGITINENADPDVKKDLKLGLNETFPNKSAYVHMEGNSDGHMKSSVIGTNETLIIAEGRPILGTWQSVYFCEFDGPRTRKLYVKILEG